MSAHASHRMTSIDGTLCCAICYVEPDWPLAARQCGLPSGPRIDRERPVIDRRIGVPWKCEHTRQRHGGYRPGDVISRWTIIEDAPAGMRNGYAARRYKARCACGAVCIVYQQDLRHGRSKGCRSKKCRTVFGKAPQ